MCHQTATMHYILLVACAIFATSNMVLGLSSKLDFGDDSRTSLVKTKPIHVPKNHELVEIIKKDDSDHLENEEVICTSGGCNTTSHDKDTGLIKTDVVVQVKTLVEVENKNKKVEDVPDIPVILGTNGVGLKNSYPSVHRGLHYQPIVRNQELHKPLVVTNIEDAFPSVTSKLIPANLYRAQTRDGVDIKFKTLPPLVVSMPDGFRYKTNGVALKVPYFEPSYQNHYYGENSPPQVAFYPRKSVHNPVAFNLNIPRPLYSFTNWNKNSPMGTQNHRHNTNCMCQNQNTGGIRWYPSTMSSAGRVDNTLVHRRYDGRSNDPGTQINDKLAPLN